MSGCSRRIRIRRSRRVRISPRPPRRSAWPTRRCCSGSSTWVCGGSRRAWHEHRWTTWQHRRTRSTAWSPRTSQRHHSSRFGQVLSAQLSRVSTPLWCPPSGGPHEVRLKPDATCYAEVETALASVRGSGRGADDRPHAERHQRKRQKRDDDREQRGDEAERQRDENGHEHQRNHENREREFEQDPQEQERQEKERERKGEKRER